MINQEDRKLDQKIEEKKENNTEKIKSNNFEDDCSIHNKLINLLEEQIKESKEKMFEEELKSEEEIIKIYNRLNKDLEKSRKFSLEKLIIDFLPIVDSIESSLNLIKKNKLEEIHIEITEKLKFIYNLLKDICKIFNIKKIDNVNVLFNPDVHQAMSIRYSNEIKPNLVVTVMQPGYILYESRLLRPAMVIVSKEKI